MHINMPNDLHAPSRFLPHTHSFCKKWKIKLLYLPKNTTEWLQPLDAGVFKHVKKEIRKKFEELLEQSWSDGEKDVVQLSEIVRVFAESFKVIAPAVIQEAFRRTGLCAGYGGHGHMVTESEITLRTCCNT